MKKKKIMWDYSLYTTANCWEESLQMDYNVLLARVTILWSYLFYMYMCSGFLENKMEAEKILNYYLYETLNWSKALTFFFCNPCSSGTLLQSFLYSVGLVSELQDEENHL